MRDPGISVSHASSRSRLRVDLKPDKYHTYDQGPHRSQSSEWQSKSSLTAAQALDQLWSHGTNMSGAAGLLAKRDAESW
jgi:hypothetical protein